MQRPRREMQQTATAGDSDTQADAQADTQAVTRVWAASRSPKASDSDGGLRRQSIDFFSLAPVAPTVCCTR